MDLGWVVWILLGVGELWRRDVSIIKLLSTAYLGHIIPLQRRDLIEAHPW